MGRTRRFGDDGLGPGARAAPRRAGTGGTPRAGRVDRPRERSRASRSAPDPKRVAGARARRSARRARRRRGRASRMRYASCARHRGGSPRFRTRRPPHRRDGGDPSAVMSARGRRFPGQSPRVEPETDAGVVDDASRVVATIRSHAWKGIRTILKELCCSAASRAIQKGREGVRPYPENHSRIARKGP